MFHKQTLRTASLWLLGIWLAATSSGAAEATEPLSPETALAAFQLHPDCRIELVAAEPDVIDPVHVAFDGQGRLWVVEYSDYPNGPADGQPGLSRIRVLTDDDADGRYDHPVLFADKLLFATGLLHWRDGVIVTTAGSVLFLRDTDGDGRADQTQEWFTGFKQENPQLRANHPTFAIDNHIYIASGLRGGEVGPGRDWAMAFGRPADEPLPKPVSLSGRDFRFDPRTGAFESVTGPGQFGLTFDDWGRRFVCDNRHPCKQIMIEDAELRRNPNVSVSQTFEDVLPAGEQSRLYPISRTWTTSNLHANQFTAACGVCIARGDALPAAMSGNVFVCDPTANLVHRAILDPRGSTFGSHVEKEGVEFLATKDEWCRPVNLANGPDGALYVVDMYRAVIEHPQFMPDELKNRPDLTLGRDRGRIYRIVAKDAARTPPAKVARPDAKSTTAALTAFLASPNAWQRESAQRLLLETDDPAAQSLLQLTALLKDESPLARGHALWLLSALDDLKDPQLLAALADPSPRVRELAARITAERGSASPEVANALAQTAGTTEDRQLRYATVLALGAVDEEARHSQLLATLAAKAVVDPWLRQAVQLAARDPATVTESLISKLKPISPVDQMPTAPELPRMELLRTFAEQSVRQQGVDGTKQILKASQYALPQRNPLAAALVLGVCNGLKSRRLDVLKTLESFNDVSFDQMQDVFNYARAAAQDETSDASASIVPLLEFARWPKAQVLLEVARSHPQLARRRQAVEVLGRRSEPEIGPALVDNLAALTPEQRSAHLAAIFSNTARIKLLLDAVEAGDCSPRLIDAARVKQLTSSRDADIKARSAKLFAALSPEARRKVIADYTSCLEMEADPRRGQVVFKANCSTCHKIGGLGVDVAPDISDSRTKTREYLLAAILDPNQAIDNNYFSYTLIDRDGLVHTGIIATETATSVTLKQPEAKIVTIPREDIEELKSSGQSLMPEGLERNIQPQQMADLLSFLKNWRYLDGSVPQEVIR